MIPAKAGIIFVPLFLNFFWPNYAIKALQRNGSRIKAVFSRYTGVFARPKEIPKNTFPETANYRDSRG